MPRLRRADCSGPGIRRRRRGKGFEYLDARRRARHRRGDARPHPRARASRPPGRTSGSARTRWATSRPPASTRAGASSTATTTSGASAATSEKFDEMIDFARALPAMRKRVQRDLATDGMPRERVLACAVRLLDRGFFRVGGEDYAEENESYGAGHDAQAPRDGRRRRSGCCSTTRRRAASGGCSRSSTPRSHEIVAALKRRRGGGEELLAYKRRPRAGRTSSRPTSTSTSRRSPGGDFSAKDFRTWNATVLAAVALAVLRAGRGAGSKTARKRAKNRAVKEVAALPRQHARGLPRLLHRPARVRPLRRRADDRRRAAGVGRGHRRLAGRAGHGRGARCST